jgi:glycosyltransferase involved in cell wall biosynthesis
VSTRLTLKKMNVPQSGAVAFCGTRGIPANYGGFETAVDEITKRLVTDGVDTVVFCRNSNQDSAAQEHNGRQLVFTSGSAIRTLDTFVSSLQTGMYLLKNRKAIRFVFWFNNANLPGILLTRIARIPFAVNTDGLEWRRAKWSWPFKLYYWLSSWVVARISKTLIADSHGIRDYYRTHFSADSEFVPYGAPDGRTVEVTRISEILQKYNVESGKFFLQITRIEPDNLPLETATAFVNSGLIEQGVRFIIIGYKDATYYSLKLKQLDGVGGVSVCNAFYDADTLSVLRTECFAYVHGNSVGGTNPALLEAMACSPRILAIDSPFSKEVLGDNGTLFDPADIEQGFRDIASTPEQKSTLTLRIRDRYSWDRVSQSYRNILEGRPAGYESTESSTVSRLNIAIVIESEIK